MLRIALCFVLVAAVFGCGSSGSCGCSGCGCRARARARAAKTNTIVPGDDSLNDKDDGNIFGLSIWNSTNLPNDEESKMRHKNPNFLFHRCCEERRLPSACVQLCHFNAFEAGMLKSMYSGNHECPLEFLPEMQFCAAQGMDHRRCCSNRGVDRTLAGKKCLTFCDQRPDIYTPIDFTYAPCFDRFEDMKRCFYDDVRSAAIRRFDQTPKKTVLDLFYRT